MTGRQVLITGATGFIGLNLVDQLLAAGDTVSCLVRKSSNVSDLVKRHVRLVYGDLGSDDDSLLDAVPGQDVVFHLAGVTQTTKAETLFEINANGTGRLLNAIRKLAETPIVVCVSSLAAAGPSELDRPATEGDCCRPVSDYGMSKYQGECLAYDHSGSIPISIVRPPIVLGPYDRNGLTMFESIAKWGVHLIPGLAQRKYSVVHVSDLCTALVGIAAKGKRITKNQNAEGIYYVAADEQPTFAELGELIGQSLGKKSVLKIRVPDFVLWPVGWLNSTIGKVTGKPMLINLDKVREGVAGSWTCSNAKIREEIRFSPACSLAERLRQVADWYRDAGWIASPAKTADRQSRSLLTQREPTDSPSTSYSTASPRSVGP